MDSRKYVLIWLAALFTLSAAAEVFPAPGYFDSYYYYHVAENLANGRGLIENFIWNYLGHPASIPQPANLYWMPLTSFLAAPFLALFGASFRVAQLPFILVGSLVPLLTAGLAWRLLHSTRAAILSAFLTLFAGFYLSYWPAVDSFALFVLAATTALVAMARMYARTPLLVAAMPDARPASKPSRNGRHHESRPVLLSDMLRSARSGVQAVLSLGRSAYPARTISGSQAVAAPVRMAPAWAAACGIAIAVAHLARPDGALLLIVALLLAIRQHPRRDALRLTAFVMISYLAVMSPWFARTIDLTGTPLPVAGTKTAWLRSYDHLFGYTAQPSLADFLDWGAANIVWSRLRALAENLTVFFGGAFFLAPLAVLGLWRLRDREEFRPFLLYASLLYLVHSLVFAFPGPRGTMLHSGVALLPWLAVASVVGLDHAVAWTGARLPHWNVPRAQRNFGMLALAGCAALGLFFAMRNEETWSREYRRYVALAAWSRDQAPDAVLLVNNPPAYTYVSGQPSIVTPSDGVNAVLAAADQFGATVLALEPAHARSLNALYNGSENHPRLGFLEDLGTTRLFAIRPPQHAAPGKP